MSVVRVGIIGFGRIGAEHAGWLEGCANIRAVAVADVTPARREMARRRGLIARERFEELIADPDIDAILISTPDVDALRAGFGSARGGQTCHGGKADRDESAAGAGTGKSGRIGRNRILSVFHNRRWDADFLAVKSAIESGVFGRIINVESRLGQWGSCVGPAAREYHPNWRNESAFGGGALFDWGSHFVDQIWQLMLPAKPVRVFAQLRQNVWSKDCDDFAGLHRFRQTGGAVGLVEINTTTTLPLPRWHIDGTAGSAPQSVQPGIRREPMGGA